MKKIDIDFNKVKDAVLDNFPIIAFFLIFLSVFGIIIVSIVSLIQTIDLFPGIGALFIISIISLTIGGILLLVDKFILKR